MTHGPFVGNLKKDENNNITDWVEMNAELETVSIAEPLQNRQHARLMLSTLERKGKREG